MPQRIDADSQILSHVVIENGSSNDNFVRASKDPKAEQRSGKTQPAGCYNHLSFHWVLENG
jgi:hypothetical protein